MNEYNCGNGPKIRDQFYLFHLDLGTSLAF